MFIVNLIYKKPLEEVERHVAAHRAFLEEGYASHYLVVSGPKNPRTGGIIVSCLTDKAVLEDFLRRDPFYIHDIADYEITEFIPVKYHKNFDYFINMGK